MAIHEEGVKASSGGFSKGIEESATGLILDNLQKYQYTYPIKSTTRELICNGVDSILEKQVARKILSGQNIVEDFFVEREGALYNDSKFDASYYDLKWLSDKDNVEMDYIVGSALEKDTVTFTDYGVGLGKHRLEGYFRIGYSTKRLSKLPLGKFGIGAKSPLSLGIDFYTVESNYNGQKYRFNVYAHDVDSIVPKFNLTTGKENSHVLFQIVNKLGEVEDYPVYYEDTEEKNSVSIILSNIKKHNKKAFIDAVKSQLLYFDNIVCTLIEDGKHTIVDYKADILYEDDLIVLSNNDYYSKPHLLLNRVNYGYINWEELELEDKGGNIGIKVQPENVEVNPSRESIMWSDKTKTMVLSRFNDVVDIASKLISKELNETDFLAWLRTCYNLNSFTGGGNTVVGRLSKIVDLSDVKPAFGPDPTIKFNQKGGVLKSMYVRSVDMGKEERNNRMRNVVVRKETSSAASYIRKQIILIKHGERSSNRKDKFLLMHVYPHGYTAMHTPASREDMVLAGWSETIIDSIMVERNKEGNKSELLWKLITESQDVVFYDKIVVPEDFTGTEEEEEVTVEEKPEEVTEEEKVAIKVAKLTAKERREQDGKIIIATPRSLSYRNGGESKGSSTSPLKVYDMQRMEMPISAINDWVAQEIYYGPEEQLNLVAMLTRDVHPENMLGDAMRPTGYGKDKNGIIKYIGYTAWQDKKWYRLNKNLLEKVYKGPSGYGIVSAYDAYDMQHFFDNKEIILINTAKGNMKYVRDFRPIEQFFIRIRNKTITMSNLLVQWNTARVIKDKLVNCAFLFNFESFNEEYYNYYHTLINYVKAHYREVERYTDRNLYGLTPDTYDHLVKHLNNVQVFQEYVRKNSESLVEIGQLAAELFGNKELKDGHAVDPEMMAMLQNVTEYADACGDMLNWMPVLTGNQGNSKVQTYDIQMTRMKTSIPEILEQEIKSYLEARGVLKYHVEQQEVSLIQIPEEIFEKVKDEGLVQEMHDYNMGLGASPEQQQERKKFGSEDMAKLFISE